MRVLVGLAAVLCSFAGAAQATTWVVTAQGRIQSGTDSTGVFGLNDGLDGNLYDARFKAAFYFDDTAPTEYSSMDTSTDHALGGLTFVTSTISIHGITKTLAVGYGNIEKVSPDPSLYDLYGFRDAFLVGSSKTDFTDGIGGISIHFAPGEDFFTTLAFDEAFDHVAVGQGTTAGFFNYGLRGPNGTFRELAFGAFYVSRLTVGQAIADDSGVDPEIPTFGIPEPSSWALMALGFGGLGGIIRHRRHSMEIVLRPRTGLGTS